MKKFYKFLKILINKTKKNELILMSNALTYKLLVALFPFIIFIITLFGFFNIQVELPLQESIKILPEQVYKILNLFFQEVVFTKRISLLSSSFILATYSASTGFYSIIQVLNRAYEQKETRSVFKVRFVSVMLVFIFAILINLSLALFVFSDLIKNFILKYTIFKFLAQLLDSLFFYLFIGIVLFCMILVIYKIAINKKLSLPSILPGSLFTVIGWSVFSKLFNIYINNFSKYSVIYGSIGSILLFFLWLNIISCLFLIGGQINAILQFKNTN